jgi:hypothetical protein
LRGAEVTTVEHAEFEGKGKVFSSREKVFFAAVFLLGIFVHLHLHSYVLISNNDDLAAFQAALKTREEGFRGYWDTARRFAENQGRFYFVYTTLLTQIPYLIEPEIIRASLLSLIYCLAGFLVTLFLAKVTREKTAALLFLPLYLFTLPIYWRWHPYASWPLYWQIPVIAFLLSQFLCIKVFYRRGREHDYRFLAAYFVLLFFSISFNEGLFLTFGLVSLVVLTLHERRMGEKPARLSGVALRFLLQFAPYAAFLVLWFSFEKKNPGRVGSLLFGTLSFDPAAVAKTLLQFVRVSLPLNSIASAEAREYWDYFLSRTDPQEPAWLFSLPVVVILMSLAVSLFLFHLLFRRDDPLPPARNGAGRRGRHAHALIGIGISLGLTFGSLILYCITGAYQEWVSRRQWYTPVYYSSIGLLIAAAFAMEWLIAFVRGRFSFHAARPARVVLTLGVAALFSASAFSYLSVKEKFEYLNTDLWLCRKFARNVRFFEGKDNIAFMKTARKIRDHEAVCIDGIFDHAIDVTRDNGFGTLTDNGKNVSAEIEVPSGKNVYYLEVVRPRIIRRSFLCVARIEKILFDGKGYRPAGREFAVVTFEGKPDRFAAAIPVLDCRGRMQTADETSRSGDALLGRFQEAVYLDTMTHQEFKPSQ